MRKIEHSRYRRLIAVVAVVAVVLTLLLPAIAMARAGGGHVGGGSSSGGSSSSRSSGSGSSSSRSSGSGSGITSSGIGSSGFGCCGGIAAFVIIIVVLIFVMQARRGGGGGGGTPYGTDSGPPAPPMGAPPVDFNAIQEHDPNFNEQLFYGRVNEMFMAIQWAWMNRNMEPARRFLHDQQFEVLNNGIQEYLKKGTLNKLDGMHIDRMEPVEISSQGDYDTIKVLITATSIDYTVDERTGQVVNPGELGDGKTPSTFQEYWTFIRAKSAQSKIDSTIKKCPNCGAPVTDGNFVKCAYCGMQMNDPTLDWVLLRIEQV